VKQNSFTSPVSLASRWLCWYDCHEPGVSPSRYHSTMVLHTHISPGGWTIGLLMAAVQGHSLTSSTWSSAWDSEVSLQCSQKTTIRLDPSQLLLLSMLATNGPVHPPSDIKLRYGGIILTGENRRTRGRSVPVSLNPLRIPHGLTRERTGASAVTGGRQTAPFQNTL
jgi:hypothetical protein